MRILHVYDFFAPGNSRIGFDLDRFLAGRGHEVHILAGTGILGPSDGSLLEGVTFHTYPFGEGLSPLGRYRHAILQNADRFETLHRKFTFDAAILNQPLCAAGALRAAAEGLPKVYFFLSPWAAEWRVENPRAGFFSRLVQAGFRNRLEGKALRECDRVMVLSRFMRDQLKAHHPGIADHRISILPGAVDLRLFRPGGRREEDRARFGLGPGPVVLTVRRLVPRMGVDLLLRAAARIPGIQVVIGGDGPLRGELESLAASLKVPARFLGYVPDRDLPALYRAADLFVLPTRALEGFGLVALEAMACGTPVLGTPVGAIPEVLEPLGLLFREASAEAIEEGVRRFFEARDPDLGERCRAHVAARYDWERVIVQAEDLLQRVIREGAGHGRE